MGDYRKVFFSSNDQDREEVKGVLNEEYMIRDHDPEPKPLTEKVECRCFRCGKKIKIIPGAEKLCILCIADERSGR